MKLEEIKKLNERELYEKIIENNLDEISIMKNNQNEIFDPFFKKYNINIHDSGNFIYLYNNSEIKDSFHAFSLYMLQYYVTEIVVEHKINSFPSYPNLEICLFGNTELNFFPSQPNLYALVVKNNRRLLSIDEQPKLLILDCEKTNFDYDFSKSYTRIVNVKNSSHTVKDIPYHIICENDFDKLIQMQKFVKEEINFKKLLDELEEHYKYCKTILLDDPKDFDLSQPNRKLQYIYHHQDEIFPPFFKKYNITLQDNYIFVDNEPNIDLDFVDIYSKYMQNYEEIGMYINCDQGFKEFPIYPNLKQCYIECDFSHFPSQPNLVELIINSNTECIIDNQPKLIYFWKNNKCIYNYKTPIIHNENETVYIKIYKELTQYTYNYNILKQELKEYKKYLHSKKRIESPFILNFIGSDNFDHVIEKFNIKIEEFNGDVSLAIEFFLNFYLYEKIKINSYITHLPIFPYVESLELYNCNIKTLKSLPNLKNLYYKGSIKKIESQPELVSLYCDKLEEIEQMPKLSLFSSLDCNIKNFPSCPKIKTISCNENASIEYINDQPKLINLIVKNLNYIGSVPNLEKGIFHECYMDTLKTCDSLKNLSFSGTIKKIESQPELTMLEASNVNEIESMPKLRDVTIYKASIKEFPTMPNMMFLIYDGYINTIKEQPNLLYLKADGLKHLEILPKLQILDFDSLNLKNIIKDKLPSLKILFSNTDFDSTDKFHVLHVEKNLYNFIKDTEDLDIDNVEKELSQYILQFLETDDDDSIIDHVKIGEEYTEETLESSNISLKYSSNNKCNINFSNYTDVDLSEEDYERGYYDNNEKYITIKTPHNINICVEKNILLKDIKDTRNNLQRSKEFSSQFFSIWEKVDEKFYKPTFQLLYKISGSFQVYITFGSFLKLITYSPKTWFLVPLYKKRVGNIIGGRGIGQTHGDEFFDIYKLVLNPKKDYLKEQKEDYELELFDNFDPKKIANNSRDFFKYFFQKLHKIYKNDLE